MRMSYTYLCENMWLLKRRKAALGGRDTYFQSTSLFIIQFIKIPFIYSLKIEKKRTPFSYQAKKCIVLAFH